MTIEPDHLLVLEAVAWLLVAGGLIALSRSLRRLHRRIDAMAKRLEGRQPPPLPAGSSAPASVRLLGPSASTSLPAPPRRPILAGAALEALLAGTDDNETVRLGTTLRQALVPPPEHRRNEYGADLGHRSGASAPAMASVLDPQQVQP